MLCLPTHTHIIIHSLQEISVAKKSPNCMCICYMYMLYHMFLLSQMARIHFYCFGCNTCPSVYLKNFGPIYVNAPLFVLLYRS